MAKHNYQAQVKMLGIPDRIVEHGSPKELHAECGYDVNGIVAAAKDLMKDKVSVSSTLLQ
jgi:1-deoxy-D-xylulose-5-phosphate synthase